MDSTRAAATAIPATTEQAAPQALYAAPTTTTAHRERRGCFCHHCKKDGFRRAELSDVWLCPQCDGLYGVRGYGGRLNRGTREANAEYWERTKDQLAGRIVTDEEDGGVIGAALAPPSATEAADHQPSRQAGAARPASAKDLPPPASTKNHRRYLEWVIAHSDLRATERQVLRAILLHQACKMDGAGTTTWSVCTAGYALLAREAGLSVVRFRAVLRTLAHAGHVRRQGGPGARETSVTMKYGDEDVQPLRALRRPTEHRDEPVSRFFWLRLLAKGRALGCHPRHSVLIGVAMAVDLLMNREGAPYRQTTVAELARWSGYYDDHVRRALHDLKRLGLLKIVECRGRRGGLLIYLRSGGPVLWARGDENLVRPRKKPSSSKPPHRETAALEVLLDKRVADRKPSSSKKQWRGGACGRL